MKNHSLFVISKKVNVIVTVKFVPKSNTTSQVPTSLALLLKFYAWPQKNKKKLF